MINVPPNLCVAPEATVRQTLETITKNGRQIALVVGEDDRLVGSSPTAIFERRCSAARGILTKCDFRAMCDFHHAEGAKMTVGVSLHQVDIPYGKFTWIPRGQYFDATDLIRLLLSRNLAVSAYLMKEYWLDVGQHHDLAKAKRAVAERLFE